MFEQRYTFSFEAAHELKSAKPADPNHPYARVHGHSFQVTAILQAADLVDDRWVMDFATLKSVCADIQSRLDHQFLNQLPGLETPTLEHIAKWIYQEMKAHAPALYQIDAARPSLNEMVSYRDDPKSAF